jgi:hypothetical protein
MLPFAADFRWLILAFHKLIRLPSGRKTGACEDNHETPRVKAQLIAVLCWAHFATAPNDGRANLPVCPILTARKRSDAGGTMGIRTQEHRSARSVEVWAARQHQPYLGGSARLCPIRSRSAIQANVIVVSQASHAIRAFLQKM